MANAAAALLPRATGKRQRRQAHPRTAGQRSCRALCRVRGLQKDLAKAAQRPVPHALAVQLAQEMRQLATLLPHMPMGRGPASITVQWMTVGPVGC